MRDLFERLLIIGFVVMFWAIVVNLTSCGEVGDFVEQIGEQVEETDGVKPVETITPVSTPSPQPTVKPTNTPVVNSFFVPNNCDNPPKNISQFDGWKCQASATQGGKIVCLLPYQFTWKPYKDFTDHHGVTMKCNKSDDHFDAVDLILLSGKRISLDFAYCANYVGTAEGKIGRQHFRSGSTLWNDVKDKVSTIEMIKGNLKTCLKF